MAKTLVLVGSFILFTQFLSSQENRRELFSVPQAYPLLNGGIPFLDQSAETLPEGAWTAGFQPMWWNVFRYDFGTSSQNISFIDAEGLILSGTFQLGLGNGFELGVKTEFSTFFPGILDPGIQGFHSSFGLPNQGREFFPQQVLRLYHEQNGTVIVDTDSVPPTVSMLSFHVSKALDILLFGKWSVQAGFKPPLPWGILLTRQWGLQAGLSYNDSVAALGLFWGLTAGGAWMEADFLPSEEEWNILWQAGVHVGWSWTKDWALLIQGDGAGTPYQGPPSMAAGRSGNLLIGVTWQALPNFTLQTGIQEEFISWTTNEVGYFFRVVYRNVP